MEDIGLPSRCQGGLGHGEELKDVHIQLSTFVKENRRVRRGIFSKCLNKSFEKEFGEEVD